jgi:hypothetical protein
VHDVDLGARFAGLRADVAVDRVGRVLVATGKVRFYSDLNSIGVDVPAAISETLEKNENYGKTFWRLKKKVDRLVADRAVKP